MNRAERRLRTKPPQRASTWIAWHPPRVPRQLLGEGRFVDEFEPREGPKQVTFIGSRCECGKMATRPDRPYLEVGFVTGASPALISSMHSSLESALLELSIHRFRAVPMVASDRYNEVRWFN